MARTTALLDHLIHKYEHRLGVSGQLMYHIIVPSQQSDLLPSPQPTATPPPTPDFSQPTEAFPEEEKEHIEPKIDLSKAPYDIFPQIDIRVGNMVECWKHPSSDNLYCERIDVGEGKPREIGSGLQKFVPIEQMSGNVCVMANLKPRKLAGFNSNGMVLALHSPSGLELVRPGAVEPGERIGLEGVLQPGKSSFLPLLNPKKKVLESCIDFFCTDSEGYACFGEKKLLTTAGYILTPHSNSQIS